MADDSAPVVTIVGAGTSGLAVAAYLHHLSVPYTILEREDCFASLWQKYAYDRIHLHLPKHVCDLPLLSMPETYPTYPSRNQFLAYLSDYVSHFDIRPKYRRRVIAAEYDDRTKNWKIRAAAANDEEVVEEYASRFLVIATGESCDPRVPEIDGLDEFLGEVMHSTKYKNGKPFAGKNVLVVGSGNSGMEVALDLAESGARTSIVVRSPMHVLSKSIMHGAIILSKYLGKYLGWVWIERYVAIASWLVYGDLSKYGIERPEEGPFALKLKYGKYPIIDLGTITKIKSGEIQVLPAVRSIRGSSVMFENEKEYPFDVIILATGFKSSIRQWLKGDESVLDRNGLREHTDPSWKGENGLFFVGLARNGFAGAAIEAQNVAHDIKRQYPM